MFRVLRALVIELVLLGSGPRNAIIIVIRVYLQYAT